MDDRVCEASGINGVNNDRMASNSAHTGGLSLCRRWCVPALSCWGAL